MRRPKSVAARVSHLPRYQIFPEAVAILVQVQMHLVFREICKLLLCFAMVEKL